MKEIIFALLIFYTYTATAQHQLAGIVKDGSDGSPVPYATTALLRPDSSVMTGVITGNDGKFVINNVAAGSYILQVSFIGYEKAFRSVNVPTQSDLGEISLSESANKLNEVIVKAVRPLVVSRADRYIVNVSDNIQSEGRDALDVLRNTPGLLVNYKGDISLMGNSVNVWIDGRPSQMSGEQLTDFLNSMQGGEIDRIEVITNPPSRYDAAGGGGIIDIRTKKGLQFGVNGTLRVGYWQGRMDNENAGASMNWRREKFNMFGNYSINRGMWWQKISQINVIQTPAGEVVFDQNALEKSINPSSRNGLRAGMDYFINPKNAFGVIVQTYYFNYGRACLTGITDISPTYNGVSRSMSNNFFSGPKSGIQVNANYQSIFTKPEQQLNLDMDYAHFGSDLFQQNSNLYYDPTSAPVATEQMRHAAPQAIDVYSAKIDYVQPLWKNARLETGAKAGQTKTDNELKYDTFVGNDWQEDANRSNRFVYTEQINAAYINISQQLGKFNLQAGLRGEYTMSKGEQKKTDEVNDTSYFNLFPTFFVNYQASQKHNFGISYSRRLSRPNYENLNPFEYTIDAYSFLSGNPCLTPAYTHNVQLFYTFAQSLMTRISYGGTTAEIMQIPYVDTANGRYGQTYGNFGKSQNMNVMMNYRKTLVKIWTLNLTVQSSYSIHTSNEASGEFVNKGSSLYVQLNNNISITPTLSAELTGMYVSGGRSAYYVVESNGNLSLGLRKQLLNKKMTLSLTINDILHTQKEKMSAQYENVNYSLSNEYDTRYVSLTVRYDFGSATVKAARNKSTGIEDETARAGGR